MDLAVRAATLGQHGDVLASGHIGAGERRGGIHDFGGRAAGYERAAVTACAGSEIDDVVGAADGFFVVLDDEHGVAEVAQVFERGEKAAIVAVVEADGGLVENVEHAAEFRTDLGGEANALAFAARQRGGGTVERNVAESDVVQELQALGDFVDDAAGDGLIPARQLDLPGSIEGARHRQSGEIGDRHAVHLDGKAFGTQTLAVTDGTLGGRHVVEQVFAVGVGS